MTRLFEFIYIFRVLWAARRIQDFLWGETGDFSMDNWIATLSKRLIKIGEIDPNNPHREVELRKRLLQLAAVSIRMLSIMNRFDVYANKKGQQNNGK